jgi:flagellin-like protein
MRMKKAQSEVIATVLLILIVLITGGIIMSFVVPFVQRQLEGTGCFDVISKVEISRDDRYTCYKDGEISVQIHIGDVEKELGGFVIELGGAASRSYEISDGLTIEGVKMFGGEKVLSLPGQNEERTYLLTSSDIPDSVSVYPKLASGQTCERSDFLSQVNVCK